jgi:DNA-directed RNA polymerase subunit RPC12/RpoP
VVEVKHGYWFISEYEYLNCSECGESYLTGADSTAEAKERLAEGNYYPYCPHCGAKMDGERREK